MCRFMAIRPQCSCENTNGNTSHENLETKHHGNNTTKITMKNLLKPFAVTLLAIASSASAALVSVTTDAVTGGNAATGTAGRETNAASHLREAKSQHPSFTGPIVWPSTNLVFVRLCLRSGLPRLMLFAQFTIRRTHGLLSQLIWATDGHCHEK